MSEIIDWVTVIEDAPDTFPPLHKDVDIAYKNPRGIGVVSVGYLDDRRITGYPLWYDHIYGTLDAKPIKVTHWRHRPKYPEG